MQAEGWPHPLPKAPMIAAAWRVNTQFSSLDHTGTQNTCMRAQHPPLMVSCMHRDGTISTLQGRHVQSASKIKEGVVLT